MQAYKGQVVARSDFTATGCGKGIHNILNVYLELMHIQWSWDDRPVAGNWRSVAPVGELWAS